ncbi:type VI secretion system-associated FHA domain protein TagH [Methylocella sp.]|uniref:type VI secretion system-associated FHA domain protein TagH n=1 Tax=Methylocella sp. TaxID=1978226 RepID=UPI0035B309C7
MGLKLTLENVANLPDGGPVSFTAAGRRGVDIGRDDHLDWTLPDPNRYISGKHCEIRYEGGAYVLTDVSSNGTFLNDETFRLRGPHRLRDGDRLHIGHYIVRVALDGTDAGAAEPDAAAPGRPAPQDIWDSGEAAPEPIDPRLLRASPERPKAADFLDWSLDVFDPLTAAARAPSPAPAEAQDWLPPPPPAPEPQPEPEIPAPRRALWADAERPPPAAPEPAPRAESGDEDAGARFLRRFAQAAGLPEHALARADAEALAGELGALVNLVAGEMKELLAARARAKRDMRAQATAVEGARANPLKFSPTAADALGLMFGPPTPSYLSAGPALREGFGDLRRHERATRAALREAARRFAAEFDPARLEAEAGETGGGLFSSRKARLWDLHVARAQALAQGGADGLADLFMRHFAQCYDESHRG